MFEGFDMSKMSQMMEQMQAKAKEMQEQAKNIEFTAKSGGGLVEVKANGIGELIDLNIDESILDDKASLQILIMSAVNEVLKMVEDNKKSQSLGIMGGMNPFGS